ncbi:hypothetical protein [Streptacidiphilus monticola]|uniref:Uncharacterized protein n=1 Tax=Streptacidiphilus monticola TaxID=2161674 RepID=A0ABW1GBL7_9ACTN
MINGAYSPELEALRHYPSLLATWTTGLAAVISGREGILARILREPQWKASGNESLQPPVTYLHPWRILNGGLLTGNGIYPQSHLLRDAAREPLRLIEPDDDAYSAACDRLEFLASMIGLDLEPSFLAEAWPGEFYLDGHWGYSNRLPEGIERELTDQWPLLAAGAFGGDLLRAQKAFAAVVERRKKARTW